MTWDLSKLGNCPSHGHHAGKDCPLCVDSTAVVPVAAPVFVPEPTEDRSSWHKGPEKELHGWLEAELIRLGISFIHARTDKKSTIANGTPDFACFFTGGDGICRFCFVELKNKSGRLSMDQKVWIDDMKAKAIPTLVTGDFVAAVAFIKLHLSYPPF